MSSTERLHALDAVRGFALLLGVVFHAGFSFLPGLPPGIWAIVDNSPSTAVGTLLFTSHIFRMSLFFFVAGFFARMMVRRKGGRGFWVDRLKRILLPLICGWIVLAPALGAEQPSFDDSSAARHFQPCAPQRVEQIESGRGRPDGDPQRAQPLLHRCDGVIADSRDPPPPEIDRG